VAVTIRPFTLEVSPSEIHDLRLRLARTRWPDELPGVGWDYGTPGEILRTVCDHWQREFDWSEFVGRFNQFAQLMIEIDEERMHVIHARSTTPGALPLLLLHGWPGSIAEFLDVIGPLSAAGADSFHVVAPSLPGYGFGGPTVRRGVDIPAIAASFIRLMASLGYEEYIVQGGDWGAAVAIQMAAQDPEHVLAIHVNLIMGAPEDPAKPMAGLGPEDRELVTAAQEFRRTEMGYHAQQSTKPQTLTYAMMDSPAGLAAWLLEKFYGWSDCDGDLMSAFSIDRLLDNISLYWLSGTIGSSMRLYKEATGTGLRNPPVITVPTGYAAFPGEKFRTPRPWAERSFPIRSWEIMPRGGHFPALQVPGLYVDAVRAFGAEFR
jgi:pimeloyl-ACP methyl ester carboxylesterase